MTKFLVIAIATAGSMPFVAPIPASLSAQLGPAYLVMFGIALFMAGRVMRRPIEAPSVEAVEKNSWSNAVSHSSTVTPV